MKGDLIERDDVLKEIWEWIANREYQYTNATHWLQKRIEAIPCAEDNADRKTENSSEKPNNCEDEPTWEQVKEYCNRRCLDIVDSALRKKWYKDEPQTCSFIDCGNFKNPDYERCIECKRKQIKLKTEQTEWCSE